MSSSYYFNSAHPTPAHASSSHHSGRGRRAPRLAQHPHKQYRNVIKDVEVVAITKYRQHFEAGRSFDLEDDLDFCPTFVSEADLLPSSLSDRSSLSSGSPEHSPQSHQSMPADTFSLNSNSAPYIPAAYQSQPTTLKLHQPAATRVRNAIPIVNPSTGVRMSPDSASVSPARMHQHISTRRW